jgi:murein DD-endopeptidase MepM/ murein hydrolase activator NlpD
VLRPFLRGIWTALILVLLLVASGAAPIYRSPRRTVGSAAVAAIEQAPAYYRPVVVGGKAFPVARSNYLSYLEFPNSWHAPRLRLVAGVWRLIGIHEGIDIMAERGTPVLAMEPGVVENVGWTFYSGTRVGVRGVDGRYYLYAHLSRVDSGIGPGASVQAGTVLGLVGNTGYGADPGHRDEFPPHLHFGIEAGGAWVDPYPTLVSLYDALVRTTDRRQADLDALAEAGRSAAWLRAAEGIYMDRAAPGGE